MSKESKRKPVDPSLYLAARFIAMAYEVMVSLKFRPLNLEVTSYALRIREISKNEIDLLKSLKEMFRYTICSFGIRSSNLPIEMANDLANKFINDNKELFGELEILYGGNNMVKEMR